MGLVKECSLYNIFRSLYNTMLWGPWELTALCMNCVLNEQFYKGMIGK